MTKSGKRKARLITISQGTQRLRKPGAGPFGAKRAAGKTTEKALRSLRTSKIATVRVTLTFTNRFGGQEPTTRDVRLRP